MAIISDTDLARKDFLDFEFKDVFTDRPDHFIGKYVMFNSASVCFGRHCKRTFSEETIDMRLCLK